MLRSPATQTVMLRSPATEAAWSLPPLALRSLGLSLHPAPSVSLRSPATQAVEMRHEHD
jgi:hypothetical protein